MRIAAIGDLHVQEDSVAPYREMFAEVSSHADVLLLCGDLTNFGKTTEERDRITEHLARCPSCYELFADADHERARGLAEDVGGEAMQGNLAVADDSDLVVLAVARRFNLWMHVDAAKMLNPTAFNPGPVIGPVTGRMAGRRGH